MIPAADSTGHESTALRDLATAGQLQRMLLPSSPFAWGPLTAAYHYEPSGGVSGDYLDLVPNGDRLYFMLGDVSGKGVVAALLMAQLHAMFRTLIPCRPSIDELMTRASALLCASSLPTQYATLVSGSVDADGHVVIVNAGHPSPLLIAGGSRSEVKATGVPIGMFCESQFGSTTLTLNRGDALLLFTDGLTEGRNEADDEYGSRVESVAGHTAALSPTHLVERVVADHRQFRGQIPNIDDLTVLALQRG